MIEVNNNEKLYFLERAKEVSKSIKDVVIKDNKNIYLNLTTGKIQKKQDIDTLKLIDNETVYDSIDIMVEKYYQLILKDLQSNIDNGTVGYLVDEMLEYPIKYIDDPYRVFITDDLKGFCEPGYLMHSEPINFLYISKYIKDKESMTKADFLALITVGMNSMSVKGSKRDKKITDYKIISLFPYMDFELISEYNKEFGHHENIILNDIYDLSIKRKDLFK